MDSASVVLVSVGNTRTRCAALRGVSLEPSMVLVNEDLPAAARAIREAGQAGAAPEAAVRAVMASVNAPVAEQLAAELRSGGMEVVRFGPDLPIPIAHTVDDLSQVGQDRLLDALGAFARSKQACIVIDAGTAVTVDFVDGEGTFHGGAIGPGMRMMLRALHEQTTSLPLVPMTREILPPVEGVEAEGEASAADAPFGRNTERAIALGVASAVRGMVHTLIDRYAAFYQAYPRVVATGGDAPLLFEGDALVEAIVPDLTLIGMAEAVARLERLDEHEE